ncbi:alpha/beta hydrolase [Actinomadura geliboluensis]|uniref:alpha/beta hydrolase n=1 Tax=Actinomadura geliboluensis TaxID=882440 RepID=UPI0026371102|nr:alpha/beta hydrolase [Actinomadura geliboluensis]
MPGVRQSLAAVSLLAAGSAAPAAGHADPYAAPGPVPALSAPALTAHYQTTERDIGRALATAKRVHDEDRARALSAFLGSGRRFLAFDPRGSGRAVEVVGDLEHADRIAVVVPGADNTLANYDSPKFVGGGTRALYQEARGNAAHSRFGVIAWLGYDSPSTLSPGVLTGRRAEDGARGLERLLTGIHRVNGNARFALLCHSYGSVVCAKAAPRIAPLPVDDIALFGSPGTTVDTAADLGTPARVWAGRAKGDWMRYVPNVRFAGLGFGTDPVSPRFGALRFDAGTGPHSAYLKPGSRALRNLTLIALGRTAEVSGA